jgi:hypothetical protein
MKKTKKQIALDTEHIKSVAQRLQADAETALYAAACIKQEYPTMGEGMFHCALHKWIYILRLCANTIAECCDEFEKVAEIKDWVPTEADFAEAHATLRAMGVEEDE